MCCSLPVTVCQEIPVGDDLLSRSSIHRVAVCTDLRVDSDPTDRYFAPSHWGQPLFLPFRRIHFTFFPKFIYLYFSSKFPNSSLSDFEKQLRSSFKSFATKLNPMTIIWWIEYLEIIRINQLLNSDREATKHSEKYEFFKTLFTWDNTGKRVYKVGNEKEDLKLKIPVVPFHSGFTIRSWSPHHSV